MEKLSALMDGELEQEQLAHSLRNTCEDTRWRETWNTYHVIGDVLRRDVTACEIRTLIAQRLAQEPTVLAPRKRSMTRPRFALALAASAAGAALVAWVGFLHNPLLPSPTTLAVAPAPPVATLATRAVARKFAVHGEYLTAHQQFSPSTIMGGVTSYVRTVPADEAETERQ